MPISIAIDGPAAAGKSTVAKRVAKALRFVGMCCKRVWIPKTKKNLAR